MDSSIEHWSIDNRTNLDEFLGAFSQMLSLKHIKFLDKTQSRLQCRSSFLTSLFPNFLGLVLSLPERGGIRRWEFVLRRG